MKIYMQMNDEIVKSLPFKNDSIKFYVNFYKMYRM